jgi:hypothetical protein
MKSHQNRNSCRDCQFEFGDIWCNRDGHLSPKGQAENIGGNCFFYSEKISIQLRKFAKSLAKTLGF